MVDDISHEGLRILLREEGVTFQRLKTWKGSTDHRSHQEQGSMIRRYIIWRNRHADDTGLRQVVARSNVA